MNNFKPVYKGQLEMASIRLVKDAPIMSENEIHNAGDAVKLLGEYLCEMDREVLCIINVKTNGIPINCSICSIGVIDQTIAQPRELLKTAILSNAANLIPCLPIRYRRYVRWWGFRCWIILLSVVIIVNISASQIRNSSQRKRYPLKQIIENWTLRKVLWQRIRKC